MARRTVLQRGYKLSKPDPPTPPNPVATAAAQTGTNIATASANANLNNVNQVTPDGSLTYDQTSTYTYTDPATGQSYQVPRFTATQRLSGAQQGIHDTNVGTQQNLATLAKDQSGRLNGLLSAPVDLNNTSVENRLSELGRARLDPQFAQQREGLMTRLSNQGIKLGSEAYDRAMTQQTQGQNDAYNQLYLSGRGQAVQEALTARNQPINEISALLSGSQVSQPNFVHGAQTNIPTTDYAGIVNNNYAQRVGAYNSANASQQALYGGLLGAAGQAAGAFALSDKRSKKDIEKKGDVELANNKKAGLFDFHYKGESANAPMRRGLMAQEVKKKMPSAVKTMQSGMMGVNYGKALGRKGLMA